MEGRKVENSKLIVAISVKIKVSFQPVNLTPYTISQSNMELKDPNTHLYPKDNKTQTGPENVMLLDQCKFYL